MRYDAGGGYKGRQQRPEETLEAIKTIAMLASVVCLLLALPVFLLVSSATALQRQEDLMAAPHVALDLTEVDFKTSLQPASGHQYAACIVEFYASWCPHCHHYMPIYEKAARYFKYMNDTEHLNVLVARVDCATNYRLCNKFKIPGFPHVMVEPCDLFVNKPQNITGTAQQTPTQLAEKVSKLLNKTLLYKDIAPPPEALTNSTLSHKKKAASSVVWTLQDVENATRMLWWMITTTKRLHTGSEKREALLTLLHWWAAAHASRACQEGARKLVADYNSTYWPPDKAEGQAPEALRQYLICGGQQWEETMDSWQACYSDKDGARGFTCALWLLFHTSAARLPSSAAETAPARVMALALRAFANNFFQCQVCQKHFSEVVARPEVDKLSSQKDAVLWLWRVHNEVNARLAKVEDTYGHSSSGDSDFPKLQWPTPQQCAGCQRSQQASATTLAGAKPAAKLVYNASDVQWDEDAVYAYMERTFHVDAPILPTFISPTSATTAVPTITEQTQEIRPPVLGRKGSDQKQGKAKSEPHTTPPDDLTQAFSLTSLFVLGPVVAVLVVAGLGIGWAMLLSVRGKGKVGRKPSYAAIGTRDEKNKAYAYNSMGTYPGLSSVKVRVAGTTTPEPEPGERSLTPRQSGSARGNRNSGSNLVSQNSRSPHGTRTNSYNPL